MRRLQSGSVAVATPPEFDQILRLPRAGMEHEFRWECAPADFTDDGLSAQIVERTGLIELERRTVQQASICFDSPKWVLTENECSLVLLLNVGRAAGPAWLVAKETVQWVHGRRDVVELTELVDEPSQIDPIRIAESRPGRFALRRLCAAPLHPFAYILQRRHKAAFRTPDQSIIALSRDEVEICDPDGGKLGVKHFVEVETNYSDRAGLLLLGQVAEEITASLALPPSTLTKPVAAARYGGWKSLVD